MSFDNLWPLYTQAIFDLVKPRRVVVAGAPSGAAARCVLDYAQTAQAYADIVDLRPSDDLTAALNNYDAARFALHREKSHDTLAHLATADIVVLDGDFNWHTIYHTLSVAYARAAETKAQPPIALITGAGWPYARRDMYREPNDYEIIHRHPYAYRGITPGQEQLSEEGFNSAFANALHEGGPRNGALTAVEDFVSSSSLKLELLTLPYFGGLAILVPEARHSAELRALLDGFTGAKAQAAAASALDAHATQLATELEITKDRLTRRTEALKRARNALANRDTP